MFEKHYTVTVRPTKKALAAKTKAEYLRQLRLEIEEDRVAMQMADLDQWCRDYASRF